MADFSRYNDGLRGGSIRVRARISKADKNTLAITEIPFGKTTNSLIESIIKANDKGKIKVKRIDDNTAEHVEILVHLHNGVSIDKTIDALYAFTDCEISISPNACVIENEKPRFLGVSEILKNSVDHTLSLLTKELEIKKGELEEEWHMSSLEKIFIENKIYNDIEDCETWEAILETIDKGLEPFKKQLKRDVTQDDIVKLTELKIKKISKYDIKKADEYIQNIEEQINEINHKLANIIPYAIEWYKNLKKKYGKGRERKTEIRNFHTIEATKVVESNKKLFVNRKEGFIGTGLRKDEYVCDCSDIDDIIVFLKDGRYYITKVDEKLFVGKDIIHVRVFKKNDRRTIYNIIYRDGFKGNIRVKRTAISGAMRDKEYNLTKGTEGSQVLYLTANPNGEAETVTVYLVPRPRLKNRIFDFDFGEMEIKGKNSMGNILTKYPIHKIVLKEKGQSTLGGRHRWFDFEVLRLNSDDNGRYLGEFFEGDKVLIITNKGTYNLTSYDVTNHYEDNIITIEKFNPKKVFSVVYYDGEQEYYYVKRFKAEPTDKEFSFIGEHPKSKLILISEHQYPVIKLNYGGKIKKKEDIINIDEFIAVKGVKAHGKRLTTNKVKKINELKPLEKEEQPAETSTDTPQSNQEKPETKPKKQTEAPPKNKKNQKPANGNSQMFFDW
jgi:topoisomerase-4 subunit A